MGKEQLTSIQGRKFKSFSMHHKTRYELIAMHLAFEPRNTISGFLENVLSFYRKYHCPECGDVTAKRVRHQCDISE